MIIDIHTDRNRNDDSKGGPVGNAPEGLLETMKRSATTRFRISVPETPVAEETPA